MSAKTTSQSPETKEIEDEPVAGLCSIDVLVATQNLINMAVVSAVSGTVLLGLLAAKHFETAGLRYRALCRDLEVRFVLSTADIHDFERSPPVRSHGAGLPHGFVLRVLVPERRLSGVRHLDPLLVGGCVCDVAAGQFHHCRSGSEDSPRASPPDLLPAQRRDVEVVPGAPICSSPRLLMK